MESLSINSLPLGFGFHPTDEELTSHYLKRKVFGQKVDSNLIPVVEIYKHEPWDLPEKCPIPTRDSQWHFFAPRDRKYPNSFRQNRATGAGYWKSTGRDRDIKSNNKVSGTKKTLVFHLGHPPNGKRTEWIMHEYYINESDYKDAPQSKDTFVLCRVTKRNGWTSQRTGLASEVQEASVQIGEGNNYVEEPKDVPDLAVHMKPSGPSDDMFDVDAYLKLLPPDSVAEFITEPNHEIENSQEILSSVAAKQEPANSQLEQGKADEYNFLSKEDIENILRFDPDNFDCFDGINIDALAAEIIPPTTHSASNSLVLESNLHVNEMDGSSMLSDAGLTSELNGSGETGVVIQQIDSEAHFPPFQQYTYGSFIPVDSQRDKGEADEFDFLSKEDIDSIFQFNSDDFANNTGLDMELLAAEFTPMSTSLAASKTFDFESKSLPNETNGFSMLSDGGFTSCKLNGTNETGITIRRNPRSYRSYSAPVDGFAPFQHGSCKLKVSRARTRMEILSRNHGPVNGDVKFSKENDHLDSDEDQNKDIDPDPTVEENSYSSDAESDSSDTSQESVITTSSTPRKSDVIDKTFNKGGETHRASSKFPRFSKSAGPNYLYLSVFVIALAAFVFFLLHKAPALAFFSSIP